MNSGAKRASEGERITTTKAIGKPSQMQLLSMSFKAQSLWMGAYALEFALSTFLLMIEYANTLNVARRKFRSVRAYTFLGC